MAGAAAVTAISCKITKKLVTIALDREQPKASKKSENRISGSAGQAKQFEETLTAATEALRNSKSETVKVTACDGIDLVGHLRRCECEKRLMIAMHGWRSSWASDFGAISDFWYANGCSVLYAEQRGQGESGGEYMGFGLTERYDCLEWIKWANENGYSAMPIYLCGISMGAATVLMAAGLKLPENVHGIMADCGYTSPYAIWKHVVEENLHMPFSGINAAVANDICKKKIRMGTNEYSTTDAMRGCKVPVMFVHGTDDRFVPIEMTYENYKACTAPKRLLVVPGAEHGMSYLVDKEAYEKAAKGFWEDFDEYQSESGREEENGMSEFIL
ncbi:MAG: alpha/beta hydrolase [Eubacteriales bacterium]